MGTLSLVEQYKTMTTKKVKAPSGFEFTVRGMTPQETMVALHGLPSLTPKDPKNLTREEIEARMQHNNEANKQGILLAVAEVGDGENQLPYEVLTSGDIAFLMNEISKASGLESDEANLARRILPGPEVQAVPSS